MTITKKYWLCECCASLLVTNAQDDASRYKCPQCAIVKCDHGGLYKEISKDAFCATAKIENNNTITGICAKARAEGWRFEYDERDNYIKARHEYKKPRFIFMGIENSKLLNHDQLGHAIAAEMNGENDDQKTQTKTSVCVDHRRR